MREKVKFIVGIAIAALLLVFFLREIEWARLSEALRSANPWLVVLAAFVGMLTFFVRALRWKYLLLPLKRVSVHGLFAAICIGFMVIALVPGRIGEFVRAFVLGRRERLKVSSVFATVVVERVLDALTLLFFFALFLLVFRFPENVSTEGSRLISIVKSGALYGAPFIFALMAVMVFFLIKPALAPRWTEKFLFFLPERWRLKLSSLVSSFVEGFSIFADFRAMAWVIFHSLLLWFIIALSMWLVLVAFHIDLPFQNIFGVVIMVAVGVAIPTPGGIGGYHKAFQIGLVHIFGVELNLATAAVLVCHAISFIPVTVVGLCYAGTEGLTLSAMQSIARGNGEGAAAAACEGKSGGGRS